MCTKLQNKTQCIDLNAHTLHRRCFQKLLPRSAAVRGCRHGRNASDNTGNTNQPSRSFPSWCFPVYRAFLNYLQSWDKTKVEHGKSNPGHCPWSMAPSSKIDGPFTLRSIRLATGGKVCRARARTSQARFPVGFLHNTMHRPSPSFILNPPLFASEVVLQFQQRLDRQWLLTSRISPFVTQHRACAWGKIRRVRATRPFSLNNDAQSHNKSPEIHQLAHTSKAARMKGVTCNLLTQSHLLRILSRPAQGTDADNQ